MSTDSLKIPTPKLHKVPGIIPNIPAEKPIHTKELSTYTKVELEELLERQNKLLANRSRLNKLPDKGKRIETFRDNIIKELSKKDEVDVAADLLSDLNIASKGASKLTNMEWNGKYNPNQVASVLDSDDDDEVDPIALLAQQQTEKKKLKILPPEPQFITSADLEEIKSFSHSSRPADSVDSSSNSDLEPHALHMCEVESHKESKVKFLPHKTTKSDCHSLAKEKARRHGKHWEITAATPPTIRNAEAQMLSLQDSIAIQRQQIENLKEIERKHAEERLSLRNQLVAKIMSTAQIQERNPSLFFTKYRDSANVGSDDEESEPEIDSDDEVHDIDDFSGGGVSVVIYDE